MSTISPARWRNFAIVALAAVSMAACNDKSVTPEAKDNSTPTSLPPAHQPSLIQASVIEQSSQSVSQLINNAPGMNQSRGADQDFGWQHTFSSYNTPGVTITSAKLVIVAYDVDSNVANGEFDGVSVDGVLLNPAYLQGSNNTWSTTTFDVPVSAITDDGKVNVFLDLDMKRGGWTTRISSSELVITYNVGPVNAAPFAPAVSGAPSVITDSDDMIITVTGPNPADPDGDAVTHECRWFVDNGNGAFLDPSFAGRSTPTGCTVPAAMSFVNDTWRVQVTARDINGAISPFTTYTFPKVIRITDTTAPDVSFDVTGTQGANGWYTSDVQISWTVADAQSAISSQNGCSVVSVTQNNSGFTSTCTASSLGGTTTKSVTVKVDKTAPSIVAAAAGTQGLNGWFTSDVAVSFNASDDMSGVSSTAACAASLATDSNGQTYDCTVTNGAGLSASASITVKRDASAPVITETVTGTAGANGWYTSDVSVSFSASDDVSGVSSPACAVGNAGETTGQSFTCTAQNGAGVKSEKTVTVKVDKTAPELTAAASGLQGTNGWFTGDVTVSFTATDAVSAAGSTAACAATLSTDSNGRTYNCSVKNEAGLESSTSITVKRDATAPTIQPVVSGQLGNNGWYVNNVSVSFNVADATSGVVSPACSSSTVSADNAGQTFSCSATDAAGNSSNASQFVKRDATQPLVAFVGLASTYTVDQVINVTCSVSDAMSGVAQQSCNGASGDAYTFTLGAHGVSASAQDNAGNSKSITGSFNVVATGSSVCSLVKRWVSQAGVANSLCVKLDNRGNQLDAFIKEVNAQAGKAVPADKAPILVALAQALKQ